MTAFWHSVGSKDTLCRSLPIVRLVLICKTMDFAYKAMECFNIITSMYP